MSRRMLLASSSFGSLLVVAAIVTLSYVRSPSPDNAVSVTEEYEGWVPMYHFKPSLEAVTQMARELGGVHNYIKEWRVVSSGKVPGVTGDWHLMLRPVTIIQTSEPWVTLRINKEHPYWDKFALLKAGQLVRFVYSDICPSRLLKKPLDPSNYLAPAFYNES